MVSKYVRAVKEELRRYKKEFPKYSMIVNPYQKGTLAAQRYEAEVWGFRDGYEKALKKVLSMMRA